MNVWEKLIDFLLMISYIHLMMEYLFVTCNCSGMSNANWLQSETENLVKMHKLMKSVTVMLEKCSKHHRPGVIKPHPQTQYCLPLVTINKILLAPATSIHWHTVYGCFHATRAELSSCDRNLTAYKGKNTYYLIFEKSLPTLTIGRQESGKLDQII